VIGDGQYDPASNPTQANTPSDWAAVLAQGAGLTDGQLYFIDSDPAIGGTTLPKAIGFKDDSGLFSVTEDWSTLEDELIGYEMVVAMSANAQGSITPLIWTKGLETDGTWDPTVNPWGNDGGHIAFMDGHVEYFDNVAQPQQLVTNTAAGGTVGSATANIEDAIASTLDARILKPVP
jgi:prepilin-type processing-associated H-X9-DG protein